MVRRCRNIDKSPSRRMWHQVPMIGHRAVSQNERKTRAPDPFLLNRNRRHRCARCSALLFGFRGQLRCPGFCPFDN